VTAGPRKWHAWSVWKTKVLLGAYLPAFTTACEGAPHRTFIDCFAGEADAVDMAGEPFEGSARIALKTDPPLTHAVFFELEEKAAALEVALRSEFPDRDIHVIGGDCNQRITQGLEWLRGQGTARSGPQLGPVFALLDPDSMELEWSTIETIAKWTGQTAPNDFSRQGRLVELLALFPTGGFRRSMPITAGTTEVSESTKAEVDRLFGNREWRSIYSAQRSGAIRGEDSWLWYVHLYRRGLLNLGYRYTSAIEVRNTSGVIQYHLVFATGNNTGRKVMKDVQGRARKILPAMVEDEKRVRRSGGPRLFEEEDADLDRYAEDPDRWASFTDDDPLVFDPNGHPRPPEPQRLFHMPDDAV
jgi:three-Cys-motif partner protein